MRLQRQIDELMAQRASEWLETLRHADRAERAAFIDWLSESKLHVQEFLEVVAVDRELAHLDPKREEDVDALLAQLAPGVAPLEPQRRVQQVGNATRPRHKQWQIGALAAGLAIVALSIVALQKYYFASSQSFTTQVGEQRTVELPDASVVQLNTDSKIRVSLGATERSVRLVHGEALFKVAPDPDRPFRVRARAGVAQAVGTQFNVYDRADGTRVSVLEGRVKVTASTDGESRMLASGEEALIRLKGGIELDRHADVARAVAWQQQRLVFDNAPLEDMVREFNRYNRSRQITLDNVPAGLHHYDGIFDATDPDSLAALLSHELDLTVERKPGEIIVRGRDQR